MPHHNITDDIKAMAREIRATGIAVAKQANQLQLLGKTLEAEALSEAAQEMSSAAERLEAWRLHKADALRGLATWLDPEYAAQELREIAQQLDPRDQKEIARSHDEPPSAVNLSALNIVAAGMASQAAYYRQIAAHHEIKAKPVTASTLDEVADSLELTHRHLLDAMGLSEPLHDNTPKEQAIEALAVLAVSLEGSPEGAQIADTIRETIDTIDGYGKWPEPSDLSDEFKAQIAIWHHKGNLRGGIDLTEESTGEIHVTVADYVHMETLYSGGLYATWAAAYAAIGVALDARKSPA